MPTPLTIPRLDMSMTEGRLIEWLVDDGAMVNVGDPVYVLEREKVCQDVEAPVAGKLARMAAAGVEYAVGTVIGEIA